MRIIRTLASVAWLLFSVPAFGWTYQAHRIVALIAYQRLTPKVRARVDELLRKHPDYATILTRDAPMGPAARARHAFLTAAAWPDIIKSDPRLFDETRRDAIPAAPVKGFPDSMRHPTWHYSDIPYSPDGTPGKFTPPPNALSELQRLIPEIKSTKDEALAAYDLLWVEHLVGDIHQPLHATSRYLISQPGGDAGGNFVYVSPGGNLHAVWDSAGNFLSRENYENETETAKYAREITAAYPDPGGLSLDPNDWLKESYALDVSDVYTFGPVIGNREMPIALPAGYQKNVQKVSRKRIAMAGYRLAGVLNRQFE